MPSEMRRFFAILAAMIVFGAYAEGPGKTISIGPSTLIPARSVTSGSLYLAITVDDGSGARSSDALVWTASTNTVTGTFKGIAYHAPIGAFVAIGSAGVCAKTS